MHQPAEQALGLPWRIGKTPDDGGQRLVNDLALPDAEQFLRRRIEKTDAATRIRHHHAVPQHIEEVVEQGAVTLHQTEHSRQPALIESLDASEDFFESAGGFGGHGLRERKVPVRLQYQRD